MRKLHEFCEKSGMRVDDVFMKTATGIVPATSVDMTEMNVVDFCDGAGEHIGFVDGAYIESASVIKKARTRMRP